MKHILLLAFIMVCSVVFGQPTISAAYFFKSSDSFIYGVDSSTTIDLGTTGSNSWDFSALTAYSGLNTSRSFMPASEGDNFDLFPTADLLELTDLGERYYVTDASTQKQVGFVGNTLPSVLDVNVASIFSPAYTEKYAPLTQNTDEYSEAGFPTQIAWSEIPPNFASLVTFPITPDSIRVLAKITKTDRTNGWGTLKMPSKTWEDVILVRTHQVQTFDVEAKALNNWIVLTPADLVNVPIDLVDTTVTYNFYSEASSSAIASVEVDPITEEVIATTFMDDITSPTSQVELGKNSLFAYPNPAVDEVTFYVSGLPNGSYSLKIFSLIGSTLHERPFEITDGSKTLEENLEKLHKGSYLYAIVNDRNKIIATRRLVIIRP